MKKESPVIAIAVADIHLSDKPPVARSSEDDWHVAMKRQLKQLKELTFSCRTDEHAEPVPVLYAGDIFDNGWKGSKCPPSLINFAVKNLPKGYGVPGQHDLENHRYEEMKHSAFGVLVQAGVITNISPGEPIMISSPYSPAPFRLHGFPFSVPVTQLEEPNDFMVEIAVVHAFIWKARMGTPFPDAPEEAELMSWMNRISGYDVAVFGDHHQNFKVTGNPPLPTTLWNCGGFFRRKSDERDNKPCAGLIHADGTVTRHYFDCSKDVWLDDEALAKAIMKAGDVDGLVEELSKLSDVAIDFAEALRRRVERRDVGKAVGELALEFMEREK